MSNIDEQQRYHLKYLKYKNKYLALENQMGSGGKFSAFKKAATSAAKTGASVAKSAASNPIVQAAALSAAATAVQNPTVQAKLAQVQTAYANSPSAQLAAQVAMSSSTVQSAMSNPTVQTAMSHPVTQAALSGTSSSSSSSQSPDDVWRTLTIDQKQKLIGMLQFVK